MLGFGQRKQIRNEPTVGEWLGQLSVEQRQVFDMALLAWVRSGAAGRRARMATWSSLAFVVFLALNIEAYLKEADAFLMLMVGGAILLAFMQFWFARKACVEYAAQFEAALSRLTRQGVAHSQVDWSACARLLRVKVH